MDSFEWNKIAGAVLFAMLVVMGLRQVNEIVNHEPEVAEKGWQVPGVEATVTAGAEAPKEEPLAVLLAKGNADDGAKVFKKCLACHSIEKGGANKVGPNLYNTVGNHFAHMEGFAYSDAVKGHGEVKVRGHTDSVPFANPEQKNNWLLSAERADQTRQLLEKRGVSTARRTKPAWSPVAREPGWVR